MSVVKCVYKVHQALSWRFHWLQQEAWHREGGIQLLLTDPVITVMYELGVISKIPLSLGHASIRAYANILVAQVSAGSYHFHAAQFSMQP